MAQGGIPAFDGGVGSCRRKWRRSPPSGGADREGIHLGRDHLPNRHMQFGGFGDEDDAAGEGLFHDHSAGRLVAELLGEDLEVVWAASIKDLEIAWFGDD